MGTVDSYLQRYEESHTHRTNVLIHKFCVPIILFSTMGILKALPVPMNWPLWLDWSTLAVFGALVFYASLRNVKVFSTMFIFIMFQIIILELLRPHFFLLCLFLFIMAWIFQFIGHKIEGKKPSFLEDLTFLLIGPLWFVDWLVSKFQASFPFSRRE